MLRTKILQLLKKPLKKYRKIKPKELKQITQKGNSNYKIKTNNIINNAQNIQGRNADNNKLDNSTDEKNAGYKTTILPKRSEKKAD